MIVVINTEGGLVFYQPILGLFSDRLLGERTRLLATISIVHKQFQAGRGGKTKIIPSPMLEIPLYKDLLVNISGVPQINSKRHHTNGLVFAQFKYHVR